MTETTRIENKAILMPELDIEKEVIVFLNYKEGGCIYIGVDKNGQTLGIDDVDDCMLRLKDRIKNNISPSAMGLFDITEEKRDGRSVVKITIASGVEKPYFKTKYGMTPRGAYLRIGTSAEPMPQETIDRLFATRTRNSISRVVSNRQDLRFEQLRIYYKEHGKQLNDNFPRTLELLTEDGRYNYIAYLLADENGSSIKVAKYSSLDRCDLIENNEYGYCSLIKATKSVLAKLEIENKTAATITPVERIETPMWDRIAIREAVINAIVHNDYSFEVPPKFEIFPDRLEITSAGRLPETMSLQEFFDGVSMPRNKELMRIFKDVELVESLGSGIPRILRAYGTDCFRFTENFIRLTLPISHPHSGDRNATLVTIQNNDIDSIVEKLGKKLGKKLGEKLGKKLGNTRIGIIQLIASNPNITYTEISKTLSVSSTTVEKRIAEMSGVIIQHVGPKKGGHWEIIMP